KDHQIRAIFVSKAEGIDEPAVLAASKIAFIRSSVIEAIGDRAIAAFQRYAAIRIRKGLLPKRSECLEALQVSPPLLGLYDIAINTGRVLRDEEVLPAAKRGI